MQNLDFEQENIEIEINLEKAPLLEVGLASRLGLAITELVINASKHIEAPEKSLRVKATYNSGRLSMFVQDNGPGLPSQHEKGSGLEMVYVTIEKQLSGQIKLHQLESGTSWEITIPLSKFTANHFD